MRTRYSTHHGVGASSSQCSLLSGSLVNVRRDGHEYEQTFPPRRPDGLAEEASDWWPTGNITGTALPSADPEMFRDTTVPLLDTLENASRKRAS